MADLSRELGRPFSFNLQQIGALGDHYRRVLQLAAEANESGAQLRPQITPRSVGVLFSLAGNTLLDDLPEHAQVIVGHDAFGHFSRAYGIDFLSPVGLSTEAEPSAADIARMVDVIRERQKPALFVENMSSPALMEQLSEETGVPIAGSLYNGALSEEGMTSHYLGMILHNAEVLHQGLVDAEGHDDSHDGHDHDHDH